MLVLVGYDERSFSLQISITKDITLIVQWIQWVKYFFMILLLCGILIAFLILDLTVNTQLAIACSRLIMEVLEQHMGCVQSWCVCICIPKCVCVNVCIYVSVYACVCIYVYVCIYICMCVCIFVIYIYIYIYIYYVYASTCIRDNVITCARLRLKSKCGD